METSMQGLDYGFGSCVKVAQDSSDITSVMPNLLKVSTRLVSAWCSDVITVLSNIMMNTLFICFSYKCHT